MIENSCVEHWITQSSHRAVGVELLPSAPPARARTRPRTFAWECRDTEAFHGSLREMGADASLAEWQSHLIDHACKYRKVKQPIITPYDDLMKELESERRGCKDRHFRGVVARL